MSSLGEVLRYARIEKGLTLDDVEETTKIRKRYLEAIEQGDYKILPGDFYVRAFIKSYAEAVGLDPAEIMNTYKHELPDSYENQPLEAVPLRRSLPNSSVNIGRWISRILMWSFPLLILAAIYYYVVNLPEGTKAPEDEAPITDKIITDKTMEDSLQGKGQTETPPPKDTTPEVPAQPTLTYIKTEGDTDWYEVTSSIGLTVELRLTGEKCWVQINKSNRRGEMIEQTTLNKDNPIKKWVVNDSVWMNIGKASDVKLIVNGTEVNTGHEPNPKRFQFELKKSLE